MTSKSKATLASKLKSFKWILSFPFPGEGSFRHRGNEPMPPDLKFSKFLYWGPKFVLALLVLIGVSRYCSHVMDCAALTVDQPEFDPVLPERPTRPPDQWTGHCYHTSSTGCVCGSELISDEMCQIYLNSDAGSADFCWKVHCCYICAGIIGGFQLTTALGMIFVTDSTPTWVIVLNLIFMLGMGTAIFLLIDVTINSPEYFGGLGPVDPNKFYFCVLVLDFFWSTLLLMLGVLGYLRNPTRTKEEGIRFKVAEEMLDDRLLSYTEGQPDRQGIRGDYRGRKSSGRQPVRLSQPGSRSSQTMISRTSQISQTPPNRPSQAPPKRPSQGPARSPSDILSQNRSSSLAKNANPIQAQNIGKTSGSDAMSQSRLSQGQVKPGQPPKK